MFNYSKSSLNKVFFSTFLAFSGIFFSSSLSFATITLDSINVTGTNINHAPEGIEDIKDKIVYLQDFFVGDGTNGESVPSFTCNLMADPDKKITFSLNAPPGEKITITPPDTGNVMIGGYIGFGDNNVSSSSYPATVSFDGFQGTLPDFPEREGNIFVDSNNPTGIRFDSGRSIALSGPVSFTAMHITIDYSSASCNNGPNTYDYTEGKIYARWEAAIGTSAPGQFASVEAVPEPSSAVLLMMGIFGLIVGFRRKRGFIQ